MLLISGMIVGLVQKPSDAVGVLTQPMLITAVWCGSGEHLTIVCIADGAYCVFFLCGEIEISVVKHDTFFLLFGILNISQAMRRPVILYGIH